jgi:bifunctional UDP-N-acetylglucosamine pyrophosphorylase/glucosamine-1-phosphate N-acetyltransferase
MSLTGLILAAGRGKRMHSELPKVLHSIAGSPLLEWVIRTLKQIPCDTICVVLSPQYEPFQSLLDRYPDLNVCIQKEANGTAGAVAATQSFFQGDSSIPYGHGRLLKGSKIESKYVLICTGDTPALDLTILKNFIATCLKNSAKLGVLGMRLPDPTGYGRLVLSDKGKLLKIVEERDTDPITRKISLCNSGILFADVKYLFKWLAKIENKNIQKEYYLTECVQIAVDEGHDVSSFVTDRWETLQGVNDKEQLAALETWFNQNKISNKN